MGDRLWIGQEAADAVEGDLSHGREVGFVADCLRGELPMAVLCADRGIGRKTGYKWLGRYRDQGPEGLVERSRAPHRQARFMAREMAEAIVALRRQRPHWRPYARPRQAPRKAAELIQRAPEGQAGGAPSAANLRPGVAPPFPGPRGQ